MSEPEPSLFDMGDADAERWAEDQAEADLEAGRIVPHDRVRPWLRSIGTPDQLPTPYSWRKQIGPTAR